jgi:cation-transporting ATPase E
LADAAYERAADDASGPARPSCALPGLSSDEVAERVAAGKSNVNTDVKTKSVRQIVRSHTLTLFNGVNLAMAALVLSTGQYRNMLFVWVVLANMGIGIFQEIRSKRIVDRLTILAARPVVVRREGQETSVALDQVVLDDLVCLSHGSQVPADGEVVWGEATMNEGLLTGESRSVEKHVGSELLSGSFVDSGAVVYRVTRVGAEGYAARINGEAKYVKPVTSEILGTLSMIIRLATYALVPLGIGLFCRTYLLGSSTSEAILTTVAAVAGMIPQGLVLLTSTVLAIATARLAFDKVLIQQFYCIETLARVDVLCLDKTGTITTGHMEVRGVVPLAAGDADGIRVRAATIASTIAHANEADANETSQALMAYADASGIRPEEAARAVAFASARKYSGCVMPDGRCLVMGAAQFVMGSRFAEVEPAVHAMPALSRVLLVATCGGFGEGESIEGEVVPVALVSLVDQIRPSAAGTLAFFKEQGVTLNVISGDDPQTVSAIARAAGVDGAEEFVDATTLETDDDVARAAGEYHVFGRVTPQQKRTLVSALKAQGHTVAMTGDGINDVLALKMADCSVAMASGSDAARNVSDVVLVDSDFAHMPAVVAEGRRSINNLQRSASLFLVKTVFSAVLALVCIVRPPYPFLPVQMSLLSFAIIGLPSFVLALEPNRDRVTGNFLANVLARSLPASVAILAGIISCLALQQPLGLDQQQVSTLCLLVTSVVGLNLIIRISVPMSPIRVALAIAVGLIVTVGCTLLRSFFEVSALTSDMFLVFFVLAVISAGLFHLLYAVSVAHLGNGGRYLKFLASIEENHGRRIYY